MSWNAFHSRGETLRTVVEIVNERRDGSLPMDTPGVVDNFADETDLVGALLLKWHARLSGNVERALVLEPMDLESAVATAWRRTAEDMPGLRLVIDQCSEHPLDTRMEESMHRARQLEWTRLAMAAGLANDQSPLAVEAGRRIEDHAREQLRIPDVSTSEAAVAEPATSATQEQSLPSSGVSFVERIKAALAA